MASDIPDLSSFIDQPIKLVATAYNAKAGAVAETDDKQVVYIDDMLMWDPRLLRKRVALEGILRKGDVFPGTRTPDGLPMQGIDGPQWHLQLTRPPKAVV
jgi:hypothetical protein